MKNRLLILLLILTACGGVVNGDKLSKSDIQKIQTLGLLDSDETIIKFYGYKKSVEGNFFTNKRFASYWQDEHDATKNEINSALYKDVIFIDTVCYAGLTYSPYMLITRNDNSTFKVCFYENKKEVKKIFEEAIAKWQSVKSSK